MNITSGPSSRQGDLLPRSKRPTILLAQDHRLVHLTDTLDWSELEQRAQQVRAQKLKNAAGRPPHLRASLGAMLLMATRKLTYREAEDLIRYYAPARYLCGLTETQWTPDFTTIQDFTQLMGEEGIKLINQYVVQMAVKQKLADPRTAVADTTAQEAAIPYPNEMGLMTGFLTSVAGAARKLGRGLKGFVEQTAGRFKAARQKAREYRLFAKTKESKDRVMSQMASHRREVERESGGGVGRPCHTASKATQVCDRGQEQAGAVARNDEQTAAADPLLDSHGLRGERQDYQPAYPATLQHRARQSGQDGGVRAELGHHATVGWLPSGHAGPGSPRVAGHEVRSASGQGPHRVIWRGAAGLRLRSRWIQRTECLRT